MKWVKFMEYFDSRNKGNKMWGLIAQQIILGQINPIILKKSDGVVISPKLSSVILDKSSTGKGVTQELIKYASDEINKEIKITQEDIANNSNKKLESDKIRFGHLVDSQEAGLTGTVVKHNIEYGMLYHNDILIFPEASSLFVKSEHKKAMVMSLQCAIEDNGYVSKMVAGKKIEYNTKTSIILFSTPFDASDSILTKEGIFQRCIVSYNNRSFGEIKENFKDSRLISRKETYIEKFKPCLKTIKEALESSKETPKQVTIPMDVNIEITKQMEEVFTKERELIIKEKNKDIFDSYLMRAGTNADKMALNMMFISSKHSIDLECYEIPMIIFKHHIKSIRRMFNDAIEESTKRGRGNKKPYDINKVETIIKEHSGKREELYNKVMESENVKRSLAISIINKIEKG